MIKAPTKAISRQHQQQPHHHNNKNTEAAAAAQLKLAANPTAATATEGTNDSWSLPKNKDKGPLVGKKQTAKKNHTWAKLQTMQEVTI